MSTALIKKSLELVTNETDFIGKKDKRKRKKNNPAGVLDLIPSHHRIVSKKTKKSESRVLLNRSSKLTVNEARKLLSSKADPTDENVKKLLLLSGKKLDEDTSEKLLNRGVAKRYIPKKEKAAEEQPTAFTEEDFKNFEENYIPE